MQTIRTDALDALVDRTSGLTDDREISVPVRLINDVRDQVGAIVDRLEWAENFVPEELRG